MCKQSLLKYCVTNETTIITNTITIKKINKEAYIQKINFEIKIIIYKFILYILTTHLFGWGKTAKSTLTKIYNSKLPIVTFYLWFCT